MNPATIPLWLALSAQLGLGVAVFRANSKSYANQSFLLVSVILSTWLVSLHFAFNATRADEATLWIRNASASGPLIVNGFNLLRLAILCRDSGWREIWRRSALLVVPSLVVTAVCYTPLFLRDAELRSGQIPKPIYGPFFFFYLGFFTISAVAVIALYLRDLRQTDGMRKVELQFVVAGCAILVALVAFTPVFVNRDIAVRFAPFRVVIFSLIIAYGIATRKIMEVGFFFRRAMSYMVLTAYLLALYTLVWWLVSTVSGPMFPSESRTIAHLAAALVVAFAMAPARGISQRFANRLFIGSRGIDFQSTMRDAATILKSVTTLQDLLDRFAKTIGEAVGTDRVFILLLEKEAYVQHYPAVQPDASSTESTELGMSRSEPTISYLETYQEVLVLDELHRIRATPQLEQVAEDMEELKTAVALGIFSRQHLAGVMLLGSRLSGRIYGAVEQNALQVLCGQLAVAIDNAQLFTEVQNARIYNETLLENLTTGVIAAGSDELVTVFNNEAGQITGLSPREIIDHSLDRLPDGLRDILCETLRTGDRQENSELVLPLGEHNAVVRASSSIFHGEQGEMLGALVVLTDITVLKRLELQIRRSDRLASIGTLSAGMAHEIKNPLVSIKTFAQLLPERYHDSDFRQTFSNLIGHEIDRIDSLVNQLLRFARPAKPVLRPMHVHNVLEKSLQLVGHRLYQKEIKLTRSWQADVDTIRADADQLEQVFLNFFLNAMEAMNRGGELRVVTEIRAASEWVAAISRTNGDAPEVLRVTIRDNGEGIRTEDIPHVFDPFFTTKDSGTGLGLSVVHGIIHEHGGHIEVESVLKKGTSFHILLPLVRFTEEVVAA
jgi:two-component system nitrogen regulation sensor histidine kinase GlnL